MQHIFHSEVRNPNGHHENMRTKVYILMRAESKLTPDTLSRMQQAKMTRLNELVRYLS